MALKFKFGFDDALDVVGVHLVGGVLGALLIGFFGTKAVGGADGVFYGGGASLLGKQALAVVVVVLYSFVVSFIIAKLLDLTIGLRVTPEEEREGLDATQHAESAYDFGTIGASPNSAGGNLVSAGAGASAEPARTEVSQ